MKEKIDLFEYATEILKQTKKGVLLTTKANDHTNCMVISWGMLGIQWATPIFIVYVRENRFTKKQLDQNQEFTINIPLDTLNKDIYNVCGKQSGYNIDKIKQLNLTLEESLDISVPGIKEVPLTLECKVVYKQTQDHTAIDEKNINKFYPQNVDSFFSGSNKDYHTAYYGEIVNAYIIK